MSDVGINALATFLGPILVAIGALWGAIKWGGDMVEKRITNLDTKLGVTMGNTDHKLRNTITRVDALEHVRASDVERIVKLETNLANLEKGQERIEHQLDKMERDSAAGRAEIIDTIREISKREIKP